MQAEKKDKKGRPKFLRLTGIAVQMGATIYLGSCLGNYLDDKFAHGEKTYLIICILCAIVLSFYVLLKQLNQINNDS